MIHSQERKDEFIEELIRVFREYDMCLGIDSYENTFWVVNHLDPHYVDLLRGAIR